MKVKAEDDDGMKKWLKTSVYQSPKVINELICLMGQKVLRCVLKKRSNNASGSPSLVMK